MPWGLCAALNARRAQANLYDTRDSEIVFYLVQMGLLAIYGARGAPGRGQRWLLPHIALHAVLRLVVVLASFIGQRVVAMGFHSKKVVLLPDNGGCPSLKISRVRKSDMARLICL